MVMSTDRIAEPNSNFFDQKKKTKLQFVFDQSRQLSSMAMAGETPNLTLYSYWRSSCAFRVRIALHLKGLRYDYKAVQLDKGPQYSPEFKKLNPSSSVPVLVDGESVISDSLAIILYLEDKYPQSPLLPCDPHKRAINFQAATIVSSGIQPFQNMSGVMHFLEPLKKIMGGKLSPDQSSQWVKYHIEKGFAALEDVLKGHAGKYATGDEVYLADLFLAPQIDAAIHRFSVDMDEFPLLKRLNEAYNQLPAFVDTIPANQPDAPANLK